MSSSSSQNRGKQLDKELLSHWGMARVFKSQNSNTFVNGMDIDSSGQYLVTTSTDNCVRFYDCMDAKLKKIVQCSKYGTSNAIFTHHSKCILEACPTDNNIRYHSLHDNTYVRTFKGHTDRITELHLSNLDDTFMSSSIDRSVRFWDLREQHCIAICKVDGRPNIAFDFEGLIFAIGTGMNELKLYDKRQYENGPFRTIDHFPMNGNASKGRQNQKFEWCSVQFSPDGKYILVSARTNLLWLVDSYEGDIITSYRSYNNKPNMDLYPRFSSDGKFVAIGDCDGDIHFWETISDDQILNTNTNMNTNQSLSVKKTKELFLNEGQPEIAVWNGHPRPVPYFMWNPRYLMCVSAAQNTAFWLPRNANDIQSEQYPKKSNLRQSSRSFEQKN